MGPAVSRIRHPGPGPDSEPPDIDLLLTPPSLPKVLPKPSPGGCGLGCQAVVSPTSTSSSEKMLTHTHACTPSTRVTPHLPGCGRTPTGSLPSARGPARSHVCQSPASGPPAARGDREGVPEFVALPHCPTTPWPPALAPPPLPTLPQGFQGVSSPGASESQPRVHAYSLCARVLLCVAVCFHVSVWACAPTRAGCRSSSWSPAPVGQALPGTVAGSTAHREAAEGPAPGSTWLGTPGQGGRPK